MPSIRAIALAVIRRPGTGELFVDEILEPGTGRTFHRPTGGGIEFGEPARRTLEREFLEEYGLAINVGRHLGALESHFVYAGRAGHEIALVFEAFFTHPTDYQQDRRPCLDQPHITGIWRSPDDAHIPLYPEGFVDLLPPYTAAPAAPGRDSRRPRPTGLVSTPGDAGQPDVPRLS